MKPLVEQNAFAKRLRRLWRHRHEDLRFVIKFEWQNWKMKRAFYKEQARGR